MPTTPRRLDALREVVSISTLLLPSKGYIMARSKEEKQAWFDKMKALGARIKAMPEEQRILFANENPVVTCEGHPLSPWNTCALIEQCQFAGIVPTQVAGFRQWKKVERQVTKEQHACGYILVPIGKGKKKGQAEPQPTTTETDDKKKGAGIRFKWIPMFDVTQTEVITEESKAAHKAKRKAPAPAAAKPDTWKPATIWDTDNPQPGQELLICAPPKAEPKPPQTLEDPDKICQRIRKRVEAEEAAETIKPDFQNPKPILQAIKAKSEPLALPAPTIDAEVIDAEPEAPKGQQLLFG